MTKEEIQASIKSIMFSGSVCGIEIYACLRDESGYQTKKIRATDKLLSSTKDKVAGFINCNNLNPFRYLEHVLTVLKDHQDDREYSFINDILPWSEKLPAICRSKTKATNI